MDDWAKGAIGGVVVGIVGALGVVGAALATGYFSAASKDEELRVHLVEIAIGILRADPKEDVAPARAWAIEVIEKNSGVAFEAKDRDALLHKPIATNGILFDQNAWLDKNFTIIPYDPKDFADVMKQWQEKMGQVQKRMDEVAPSK
jgi:hypothetical protein